MGITSWIVAGLAAFLIPRIIPPLKPSGRIAELFVSLAAALAAGVSATAFDFGGWKTLDWRAGSFCFLTSFAILGALRLVRGRARRKM